MSNFTHDVWVSITPAAAEIVRQNNELTVIDTYPIPGAEVTAWGFRGERSATLIDIVYDEGNTEHIMKHGSR